MPLHYPAPRIRTLATLVATLLVALTGAAGASTFPPGHLYVTSDASNLVRVYQPNGAFAGIFTPSIVGNGQMAIHFGATNNRVLVGHAFGGVDEFDATSGAYIKTYNPAGGWQWAGLYAPNGNVYIGSMNTADVREYDAVTGAFIRVVTAVPDPADMRIGPNGHLYICSFGGGFVLEVDATTGGFIQQWPQPSPAQTNDIAFLPNGDMIVTVMRQNLAFRYDPALNIVGVLSGTGWGNPHGVEIDPVTGNILIVDGVSGQVHVFDPVTNLETNPAFLVPTPGDKIVDLDFRPDPGPTPTATTTWGRIKSLYR